MTKNSNQRRCHARRALAIQAGKTCCVRWSKRLAMLLVLAGWACHQSDAEQPAPDEAAISLMESSQHVIAAYHRDAQNSPNVVRVVYFHPRDRQPLAGWRERLTRTLDDVGTFYRDGLRRFGVAGPAIQFEQDDAGYVFHLVEGELPASEYDYSSGGAIERELRDVLGEAIDFQREHVLTVHGLCHQEKDGRYVFNAPYYGRGSQRNGFCHAADCELLDPGLLKEKDDRIVYNEHYYPRQEQTVGKFNSWYLGGLAHELGHGIGLPHNAGLPRERVTPGAALMGSGNHHYREELWGGTRPAYLSLSTALRLIAHPLITNSNYERFVDPEAQLDTLDFSTEAQALRLAGSIRGSVPAYAAIAYLWSPRTWPGDPQQDHLSISHPTAVSRKRFDLKITDLRPGDYRLRFSCLHCNGAVSDFDFHLQVDRDGKPNARELNQAWLLARAESKVLCGDPSAGAFVLAAIDSSASSVELKAKLKILSELLDPPAPIDLATTPKESVSLSDANWNAANVGWRDVARNHYDRQTRHRNSIYLELKGKFYDKGLYAHSPSNYRFDLDQRWKTFTATVGLRDGAAEQGSAVFEVLGDGKVLYRSPLLRAGQHAKLKVDISDVQSLKLVTQGGEGHNHNSWAIWAAPMLSR